MEDVPLITFLGGALVALDPERGAERWVQPLTVAPLRVLVVGSVIFVTLPGDDPNSSVVRIYDLAHGTPLRAVDLDFPVRNTLTRNDLVYFAGLHDLACLTIDGSVRFRYRREVRTKSAWNGDTHDLVLENERGEEVSRRAIVPPATSEALLVLGDLAAQPHLYV